MYQLASITNTASGSPVTYASYTYDALGQLTIEDTQDPAQKKYIRYDVTGKVTAVARDAAFTEMVVEYVYDELGQRIMKKTYNSSHHLIQNTYYVGDVIYTQPVVNDIPGIAVVQEYGIDGGSGRIGIYYRQSGIYAYQLTDHLGNVRAVVAKNSGTLEVRLYNDYYPFGTTITPGTTGTNDYRYGYQGQYAEKDPETDWNAFELRMYDSKIARWLSVDPKKQFHSPYVAMGNNPLNGVDKDGGEVDGDIYNLKGVHIGNDGIDDHKVYLKMTFDDTQLSQGEALRLTTMAFAYPFASNTIDITDRMGLTNEELNLRAALSTLKQSEAGRLNPPLDYNSWNNGDVFTTDSYSKNPNAYANHPGTNSPYGSAAGAYQFLKRYYFEKDFSPSSQDKAAVKNMTLASYTAALSGDMEAFILTTKARWTSLNHWNSDNLQNVFYRYRAQELLGKSNIGTPVGQLLRKN